MEPVDKYAEPLKSPQQFLRHEVHNDKSDDEYYIRGEASPSSLFLRTISAQVKRLSSSKDKKSDNKSKAIYDAYNRALEVLHTNANIPLKELLEYKGRNKLSIVEALKIKRNRWDVLHEPKAYKAVMHELHEFLNKKATDTTIYTHENRPHKLARRLLNIEKPSSNEETSDEIPEMASFHYSKKATPAFMLVKTIDGEINRLNKQNNKKSADKRDAVLNSYKAAYAHLKENPELTVREFLEYKKPGEKFSIIEALNIQRHPRDFFHKTPSAYKKLAHDLEGFMDLKVLDTTKHTHKAKVEP